MPAPVHQRADAGPPTVVVPGGRTMPGFILPDWWGVLEGGPASINYGDIQFPRSNAIAPDQYLTIAYGQVRIGGTAIDFGPVSGQEQYHGWGAVAWCEGEIESIDTFYVDGVSCPPATLRFGTRGVAHFTGTGSQYCQDNSGDLFCPFPRTNPGVGSLGPYEVTGLKTAAYTKLDLLVDSYTATSLPWWALISATSTGPYEFAADIHGLKLYDPRTGLTVYSNNPALIVRDLFVRVGKLTSAEINDTSIGDAADACDAAGFTCNVAFAARTTLGDMLAVVLQTCNGFVVESEGKRGLFVDVVNAGAAVMTASEADGDIWGLDYEWLSVRDRYTSVAVSFLNKDADYQPDMTRFREDPGIALGVVPAKPLVVQAPGINTMAAANKLRDYTYAVQTVAFRMKGTMNGRGIVLGQGSKVRFKTLKGIDADFLITQITGSAAGFFSYVAKPYSAAVYSSVPGIVNPPVVPPPGLDPDVPPPPAAPRHQTMIPPTGANQGVAFDFPRVYSPSGPYGSGDWAISGTGASGDTAKINDGVTNVVAVTSTGSMVLHLDRGVVPAEVFGKLNFWIDASLVDFFQYGTLDVEYSDDDASWTDARISSAGYGKTTPWQDAPTAGIYPCHVEIPDSIGAHRYWRISFFGIGAGLGTLNLYEAEWETFAAYTGAVVGYQIRTWPGGGYDGAFPFDLNGYDAPLATSPAVFTLPTLPTDLVPFSPVDAGALFEVVGDTFSSMSSTFRAAFTTIGAVKSSGTATPGSIREIVAASATRLVSINGDTTEAQTLTAGANITITDDGVGGHTIAGTGGGSSPLTTKGDIFTRDASADARLPIGADGKVLTADSSKTTGQDWKTPTTGTLTSVGLTAPADLLAVGSSPLTGAGGTIALTKPNVNPNLVYAGPGSGGAAAPTFRALVPDDVLGVGMKFDIVQPSGIIDGINKRFVLPHTPTSARILFFVDNMPLVGGNDYTRLATVVNLRALANAPRQNVIAAYPYQGVPDAGNPEAPVQGTATTWVGKNAATRNYWNAVCFGEQFGVLVAVGANGFGSGGIGGGGVLMISADGGTTWSSPTIPACDGLSGVAFSPTYGRFAACTNSGTGGSVLTSDDGGATWTQRSMSSLRRNGICWGGGAGGFVSVGASPAGQQASYSADGTSWTTVGIGSISPDRNWESVCYSPSLGLYCAVASDGFIDCVMTSPSGLSGTWTVRNAIASVNWQAIVWADALGLFVAVGSGSGSNAVMTSPDGITWTQHSAANNTYVWRTLAWSAEKNLLVSVGDYVNGGTDKVMTSPDGVTWTLGTSIANSRFYGLCSAETLGLFVAVAWDSSGNQQVMVSAS